MNKPLPVCASNHPEDINSGTAAAAKATGKTNMNDCVNALSGTSPAASFKIPTGNPTPAIKNNAAIAYFSNSPAPLNIPNALPLAALAALAAPQLASVHAHDANDPVAARSLHPSPRSTPCARVSSRPSSTRRSTRARGVDTAVLDGRVVEHDTRNDFTRRLARDVSVVVATRARTSTSTTRARAIVPRDDGSDGERDASREVRSRSAGARRRFS
jgi:hypothetical protein